MYENDLQFISTQIKDIVLDIDNTENSIVKKASSEKLDTEQVLNFIKFFAK